MFDTHMLTGRDIRHLALQRTSSLIRIPAPQPRSPSLALWEKTGSSLLLDAEVRLRRRTIVEHCLAEIAAEIEGLLPALDLRRNIALMDIGPGLGVSNVILGRVVGLKRLCLVDIEEDGASHFGFRSEGAGYSSLSTAAEFIGANLASSGPIETCNPRLDGLEAIKGPFDLVTSFLSCGFHYPAETYLDLFRKTLAEGGRLVLDLRAGEDHESFLQHFEISKIVAEKPKHRRVLLKWAAKSIDPPTA